MCSCIVLVFDILYLANTTQTKTKKKTEVWEQGVFAPDFQYSEDNFQRKIAENPSVLHNFLVSWWEIILIIMNYMIWYDMI